MIKKQIYISISNKDDLYIEKMLENDPDFANLGNLASMALKQYIKKYKEDKKDEEWKIDKT